MTEILVILVYVCHMQLQSLVVWELTAWYDRTIEFDPNYHPVQPNQPKGCEL